MRGARRVSAGEETEGRRPGHTPLASRASVALNSPKVIYAGWSNNSDRRFVRHLHGSDGKYCCFGQFVKCVMSDSASPCECGAKEGQATALLPGGSLPKLPKLPSLLPMS